MDVFSAVNRLTSSGKVLGPDQRIDVMEALRGVTINGAYMQRLEVRSVSGKGQAGGYGYLGQGPHQGGSGQVE